MARQVVLLPGICGTELILTVPGSTKLIWADPVACLILGVGTLQLAADGFSPGPLSLGPLVTGSYVKLGIYEPLHNQLSRDGWTVAPIGYDWRQSILRTGPLVAGAIANAFPADDYFVVCHSMGGLVARKAYNAMGPGPARDRWKRTVYLGTPHGGSHASAWEMAGTDWIPGELALVASYFTGGRNLIPGAGGGLPFKDELQATVASWPGLYELFPSLAPKWLPVRVSNEELTRADQWPGSNNFVTQARLDSAYATIAALDALISQPSPEEVCVVGRGVETRDIYLGVNPAKSPRAWGYTTTGDGAVTTARGVLPGRKEVNLPNLAHQDYMHDRRVLGRITSLLTEPLVQLPSKLDPAPAIVPGFKDVEIPPADIKPLVWPNLVRRGDP